MSDLSLIKAKCYAHPTVCIKAYMNPEHPGHLLYNNSRDGYVYIENAINYNKAKATVQEAIDNGEYHTIVLQYPYTVYDWEPQVKGGVV